MGGGFAGEEEMKVVQQHLTAEGLVGVKIVAQQGVVASGIALGVGLKPALGSSDLAVLFDMSILRDDEFGPQRHHVGVARADNDRGDGAVKVGDLPLGMLDVRTVGTVDVLR